MIFFANSMNKCDEVQNENWYSFWKFNYFIVFKTLIAVSTRNQKPVNDQQDHSLGGSFLSANDEESKLWKVQFNSPSVYHPIRIVTICIIKYPKFVNGYLLH